MPSVGVFVPNGNSVDSFRKRLTEEDDLGEIRIEAGSYAIEQRVVWYAASLADKVYELKEVKEMEFEVVFFYDLATNTLMDKIMFSRYCQSHF